jgi:hypothetical protein
VGIAGAGGLEKGLRLLPGLEVRAVTIRPGALVRFSQRTGEEHQNGKKGQGAAKHGTSGRMRS